MLKQAANRLVLAFIVSALGACAYTGSAVSPSGPVLSPDNTPVTVASPGPSSIGAVIGAAAPECSLTSAVIEHDLGFPAADMRLVASFATTTAGIVAWQIELGSELGGSVSTSASEPPSTGKAAICYFDGDFGPPHGPVADGTRNYDRLVVAVEGTTIRPLAAGWQDGLPIIDPNNPKGSGGPG